MLVELSQLMCRTLKKCNMSTGYAILLADVYCNWKRESPRYRLFVNGELFVERQYIWRTEYLEEMIPIWTSPGDYTVVYELVPGTNAKLEIKNLRIADAPPGSELYNNRLHIIS